MHPTNEEITNFPQQAKTFQKAYKKLTFAEPNNQMHQLPEHSFHYLNMPQLKSIGKLSTEGNEAGNRRFKNEKNCILLQVAFKAKWNNLLDLNGWQHAH